MAQYICMPTTTASTAPALPEEGNPTYLPSSDLFAPGVIHTFLIRTPEKAVPSYHKLCTGDNCSVTGFEYFDPAEVGLAESRRLYEFVKAKTGEEPLLIDSADLLEKPEAYMKAYCDKVGVEYTKEMLEWSSGTQEHVSHVRVYFCEGVVLMLRAVQEMDRLAHVRVSGCTRVFADAK